MIPLDIDEYLCFCPLWKRSYLNNERSVWTWSHLASNFGNLSFDQI